MSDDEWVDRLTTAIEESDQDRVAEIVTKNPWATVWVEKGEARIQSIGDVTDDGSKVRDLFFEAVADAKCGVFGAGYNPDRKQFYVHLLPLDDERLLGYSVEEREES